MNTGYIIRPAGEDDVKAVARLCEDVNPFAYTGESSAVEFYERLFSDALKNEDALLIVAQAESTIVGFAYVVIERTSDDCIRAPYANLDMIGVKRAYRGRGIAKVLIEEAQFWAHKKGMRVIQLAVAEDNQAALGLYSSLGYRTVMRKMQKKLQETP